MAMGPNIKIFKHIKKQADQVNLLLGKERGEAPDMKGSGKRFAHMIAIAPNASSSVICGNTSPSIEPLRANAFSQKTLSGSFLICLLYTSPSPRDGLLSRMPSSA